MTTLETRKHILVMESELTRVQLAEDWGAVQSAAQRWGEHARPVFSVLLSLATVSGAFSRLYHRLPHAAGRGWISRTLRGVQTGAAVLQAVRSRRSPRG
jgi:hypothetical protein